MDSKKTQKSDLESRKINFFLLGAIIALTLSWFAIDGFIFVKAKAKAAEMIAMSAPKAVEDMTYEIQEEQTNEEEPEQQEEDDQEEEMEDLEMEITETEEVVETKKMEETDENTHAGQVEVIDEGPTVIEKEEEEEIIRLPQVKASFPGGQAELYKWLGKNVQYPKAARDFNIQGTVVVQFVVEKNGSIGQAKIMSSVHETLDEEALRLVNSMPKWTAAKNNGEACRSYFVLPIQFNLQ